MLGNEKLLGSLPKTRNPSCHIVIPTGKSSCEIQVCAFAGGSE